MIKAGKQAVESDTNFDKIRLFNAVNIEFGYKPLQIFSPREVATYGREED